jgi:putative endonuclease
MTTARKALGAIGEHHARLRLEATGLTFVAANWRQVSGEIDLIMRDGDTIVMVEVKVRRGERAGRAEESVSPAKAARLLKTGEWFMAEHPEIGNMPWRIDLVAVTLDDSGRVNRFNHIRDAVVSG